MSEDVFIIEEQFCKSVSQLVKRKKFRSKKSGARGSGDLISAYKPNRTNRRLAHKNLVGVSRTKLKISGGPFLKQAENLSFSESSLV